MAASTRSGEFPLSRRRRDRHAIGANGAGKSSILKAISGMVPAARAAVTSGGQDLLGVPAHLRLARHGPRPRGPGHLRQPDGPGEPAPGDLPTPRRRESRGIWMIASTALPAGGGAAAAAGGGSLSGGSSGCWRSAGRSSPRPARAAGRALHGPDPLRSGRSSGGDRTHRPNRRAIL